MLESDAIRESLVTLYELDTLYDIEKDEPHYKNLLYKEYADNVQFKKTKYESVEISALRAWSIFGMISLGVIISGYFLAFSVFTAFS